MLLAAACRFPDRSTLVFLRILNNPYWERGPQSQPSSFGGRVLRNTVAKFSRSPRSCVICACTFPDTLGFSPEPKWPILKLNRAPCTFGVPPPQQAGSFSVCVCVFFLLYYVFQIITCSLFEPASFCSHTKQTQFHLSDSTWASGADGIGRSPKI